MTNTNINPNLQVVSPCLDEPPPPPVPPPPPPPKEKPRNCVQCSAILKDSPARRSGPQGPGTLCNACGLRILKRKRAARGAIKKSPRRARQNNNSRQRQSQSQNNNHTQPPRYPNIHLASASTDLSVAHPSTAQHSLQPRLFNPINSSHPHASPSSDSRLSPVTSASTSVAPSPTIPRPQPPSAVNPASVDIIQPNTVPTSTINLAHNSVPCSGALHAHNSTPAHQQNVVPSVHQTQSSADPLYRQISPGAPPKNQNIMHAQSHHHAMPALSGQYADPESASAEQMLTALQIGEPNETGETTTQGSDNTIDQADFSADVFGRCDSAGTTSTQLDLVEALGMEMSPEQLPPGNGIVPVEGPYDDNVDPITMAMGSMPMTTPVSMAPTHFSEVMPVQSSPMPTVVVRPSDITTCMDSLNTLGQMNSHITQSVSNLDERIAALARKHEELTQVRNQVILSITQLEREKNVAAKKQRQVCDDIARTTCLLQFLQKQEPFPTGA